MTAPDVSPPGASHRTKAGLPHRSPTTGLAGRSGRSRWYLAGHLLVAAWLVGGLVVAVAHPYVPRARWLVVHLLLLGGASTAVLVWSEHFALALLHREDSGSGRSRVLRLGTFTAGAAAVTTGVVTGHWPVVLAGGLLVAATAATHALVLVRMTRGALAGRFAFVLRYYVAAASLLSVGAGLGVELARADLDDDLEARLRLAHEAVNVLGWLGLTLIGTLATLWPTMLRTRLVEGAEDAARRAVPLLVTGVALVAGAAVVTPPPGALPGLACYAAGVAVSARPLFTAARRRPPTGMPTWSVAAAGGWLTVTLAGLTVVLLGSPTWTDAGQRMAALTPGLAVGWIAQTLLGALAYLVPVLIGGGPRTVRAMVAVLDRAAAARVTTLNAALAVAVLPSPSAVRVSCTGLVLIVLLSHLWLLIRAALTGRALPRSGPSAPGAGAPLETPAGVHGMAGAACGLATVVLTVAVGAALAPTGLPVPGGAPTAVRVTPTGHTTTVAVQARGMRFSPARIDVPAGDRLVLVVHNADDDRHDLVLSTGARTPRIPAGQTRTLDAGVIGDDEDGWCSVAGHRQMGMALRIHAVGTTARGGSPAMPGMTHQPDATLDPMAAPGAGFTARDARLDPLPATTTPRVQRRTITVREVDRQVAPGVRQRAWTFDGTVPGPVLHGRVGDTFEITLVNAGSIGHSIDFHAGTLSPAAVMHTIQPGQSLVYRFTATRSGIWMYHCSTMPMSLHIANGMFGAVVIDPPDLAPAGRQYVLLQSEDYLGPPGGIADTAKLSAVQPDAVVFNGYPNQYLAQPLTATVGERVRIWVLAAGPNLGTSFHVVGGQFDTLYTEGAYRLRPDDPAAGGAQVLDLGPAAGGFVELTFPQPVTYPFVSHRMVDAERGARGAFTVSSPTPPPAPESPRTTPEGSARR